MTIFVENETDYIFPFDPIEMSSAGFPVKLVFDESYFLLRFLRNLRDLGISWKCGIK